MSSAATSLTRATAPRITSSWPAKRSSSSSVTASRASRARWATSARLMPRRAADGVVGAGMAPESRTAAATFHRHDRLGCGVGNDHDICVGQAVRRVLPAAARAARPPRRPRCGRDGARRAWAPTSSAWTSSSGRRAARPTTSWSSCRRTSWPTRWCPRPPTVPGVQVESIRPYAGPDRPAPRARTAGRARPRPGALAAGAGRRRGPGVPGRLGAGPGTRRSPGRPRCWPAAAPRRSCRRCPRRGGRPRRPGRCPRRRLGAGRLGAGSAPNSRSLRSATAALLVGRPALRWLPSELVRLQHLAAIAATVSRARDRASVTAQPRLPS